MLDTYTMPPNANSPLSQTPPINTTQKPPKVSWTMRIVRIILVTIGIVVIVPIALVVFLKMGYEWDSGTKTMASYSCVDSTIDFRVSINRNFLSTGGDSFRYALVRKKEGKETELHERNTADSPFFIPLPVNTQVSVKVFQLPSSREGGQGAFGKPSLLNIFIPETISEQEFESIVLCFEANREKLNADLVALPNSILPERYSKEYYEPEQLGGLAHIDYETHVSKLRDFTSEFHLEDYSLEDYRTDTIEIRNNGAIYRNNGYIGDLFTASPFTDGDPELLAKMKNEKGERLIDFIQRAQKALGVEVSQQEQGALAL